jgi:hypothetical protein
MARIVRGGLIQASNPEPGTSSVKKIKQAMIEKHVKLIAEAARKGAEVVCWTRELARGLRKCPLGDSAARGLYYGRVDPR